MLGTLAAVFGAAALPPETFGAAGKPRLLNAAQTALVTAVADTLIPRTDTPGAVAAKVPATFDALLRDWASPAHRSGMLAALGDIDAAARNDAGKTFAALSPARRKSVLSAYDATHFAGDATYRRLKTALVTLYYLSKPGATVELRYEHVPGAWEASIPLTPQTRSWGGHNVG
jgi:hypothetical protein